MDKIQGQSVGHDKNGNITIHIKSLFLSAGKIYGFPNNSAGIGINEGIVDTARKSNRGIIITIGSNTQRRYFMTPYEVLMLSNEYSSVYEKNGVKLCVVPVMMLKPLEQVTDLQLRGREYLIHRKDYLKNGTLMPECESGGCDECKPLGGLTHG